ncbi:MAG: polysaccharide export protein [Bacteroidales bacterium]|nr:polysaccharide export protein [Bacteroidales bacterium]
MKIINRNTLLCLIGVMTLASCASRKEFVYLEDMKSGLYYPIDKKHDPIVHRDDRLSITVNSKNPELAIPFNVQGGSYQVNSDGTVATSSSSSQREKGYRVDINGNIEFPMLGVIHVEGMTLNEVTEVIRNRIIEGNYIKNPLVMVEIMNFKYTVMGAVRSPGTKRVEGDRVTILEAIASAGDLNTNAATDRVAVIREVGETRQIYHHDLSSRKLFESPCFYLQQNDIVYVEPKYKKRDTEDNIYRYSTWGISLSTSIISLYLLLSNLLK